MKPKTLTPLLPLVFCGTALAAPQDAPTVAQLEAKFEKLMSACRMVGHFTETGSKGAPQEESYTIAKVEKVRDGQWRFDAKIEYGDKSVTVPLTVPVRWAGDTPMIQVTDMNVPLLGTYSARVLIHGDRYAGVWSGADHGGHMYGKIVRAAPKAAQGKTGSWTNWRGPEGTGVAPAGNPPMQWSEDENVRWKVAVPGLGSSSPVIFGDRIYLTTAIATDVDGKPPAKAEPPAGGERGGRRGGRRGGGRGGRGAPTKIHEFAVLALDRRDGSVVWRKTVKEAVPHEGGHATGSLASNSPLTDGERLFASFGSRGVHCLDMGRGDVLWSVDLGQMRTRNGFGEGASPALHGDTLVVNWDHEGDSFVAAFDKLTGEERWRMPRDEVTSWSTPLIATVDGRPQVIITATGASRGYDLESGEELWSCTGMTTNSIPSPIHRDGIAYLMSGYRGYMLQAVRLAGAKGDISGAEEVLWSHGRGTSYVPSALLYGDYIYFLRGNNAVLSCLDAKTGAVHYEAQKVDGLRSVYSSPVGAAGRVYLTSREGTTKVLKLGPVYEELATNLLADGFDATAAIVGSELYLRGREHLYCIAEQ